MAKAKANVAESDGGLTNAPATMKPEIVVFQITGMSPLLQNNPINFIGVGEDTGLIAGKKQYNDAEEAALRVYLDPEGNFCHPTEAFIKSMVRAVTGRKFGKFAATSVLKGSVFIAEPYSVLEDESGQLAKTYGIDKRPVVIGKARVPRVRPCWNKWRMRVPLEIDVAIVSPQQVEDSLALAGRIVGIGDYRPEKGGGFGRFTAKVLK